MFKLDAQHIIAALALVAAGFMLAKHKAGAPEAAHNDVAVASDWWTYAGNWGS